MFALTHYGMPLAQMDRNTRVIQLAAVFNSLAKVVRVKDCLETLDSISDFPDSTVLLTADEVMLRDTIYLY